MCSRTLSSELTFVEGYRWQMPGRRGAVYVRLGVILRRTTTSAVSLLLI
jgi:hypothetical protein